MKILYTIILLIPFLFYGCIQEEIHFHECCRMEDVLIKFRYEEDGVDVFGKTISRVHLFVFNQEDGKLVLSKQIEQSALNTLRGTQLHLPYGKYQVVCWGNAYEHSEFHISNKTSQLNDSMQTYIVNAKVNSNSGYVENGDKLYYGPYIDPKSFYINLSDAPKEAYTMDFRTAHIKIDVYVTGFTDPSIQSPSIELTNLTPKYNFKFNKFGEPITYKQITEKRNVQGIKTEVATFYTPLFNRDNDIQIILRKQSDNQTLETINLKEFINKYYRYINLSSTETVNLKIEFKYTSGKVTVSIPTWKDDIISPEV